MVLTYVNYAHQIARHVHQPQHVVVVYQAILLHLLITAALQQTIVCYAILQPNILAHNAQVEDF
jgi:hypothetical protein